MRAWPFYDIVPIRGGALFLMSIALVFGSCVSQVEEAPEETSVVGATRAAGSVCTTSEVPCTTAAQCTGVVPTGGLGCSASVSCNSNGRCQWCPLSAGTTCRAAAGPCDDAETCDGTAIGCPSDRKKNNGFVCNAAGPGLCDLDDTCDGLNNTCNARVRSNGVSCRGAAGVCDLGESCNGSSPDCPADAKQPASTICRASGGICDIEERCAGGNDCPNDAFQPSTLVCDPKSPGEDCDIEDRCTGSSAACPGTVLPGGTPCRPADGQPCDVADTCNGTSQVCNDAVQPSSFVCNPSGGGDCDRDDTCPGGGRKDCPPRWRGNSTTCRPAVPGGCDQAEVCQNNGPNCPPDAMAMPGTTCRPSQGACDVVETCTGAATCPPDGFLGGGTVCRPSMDPVCDPAAEVCSGSSAACPAPGFAAPGTSCNGAPSGECDAQDTCNANGTCTANYRPLNTDCGPAPTGQCDNDERCTGTAAACPVNTLSPAGTVCRPASGSCDVAETCNGSTDQCPTDTRQAAGATCRNASGLCDVAEVCDASGNCPANAVRPASHVCRVANGACDVDDTCDGATANCPVDRFAPNSTVCRAAAPGNTCDETERCTGTAAACPGNASLPNGTRCDADNDLCNGVQVCQAGTCGANMNSLGGCDDNNPCTADSCDPLRGCVNTPVTDNTPCDDGRYCSLNDACIGGTCRGLTPRACPGPAPGTGQDCKIAECDETNDRCTLALNPAPNSPRCVDAVVEPYMLVVMDNSESMIASTGSGVNSCFQERTRMSDAKCAFKTVVNTYGDIVFGLERFKTTCDAGGSCGSSGCSCGATGATCPATCVTCNCTRLECGTCDPVTGANCPANGNDETQGEILVPTVEDNDVDLLKWVDFSCASCAVTGGNPEVGARTFTPIAGSLRTARRYFENRDPVFPSPIDPRNSCRPYYVILLTDGTEQCTAFSEGVAAAQELRRSTPTGQFRGATPNVPYDGRVYDVKTYVIGFGTERADERQRVNDLASAGGTVARFADDEASVAAAFAQILEDSIKIEVCNGVDDDCDDLIDEGFTKYCNKPRGINDATLCVDPGDPCNNDDDNCFQGIDDEVRNACGTCGSVTEICDRQDNDCDGSIDEGDAPGSSVCRCPNPQPELCDGVDNDCDGMTDEDADNRPLGRSCGTDVGECVSGTEECNAGEWTGCTATGPTTEICDTLDNDCDGLIDGVGRPCDPISGGPLTTPPMGACLPGAEICLNGAWGACTGGVRPSTEFCDGVDNDCDGMTDEADPSAGTPCVTSCGPGAVRCISTTESDGSRRGDLRCVFGGTSTAQEACNGLDDDCDGETDEGLASRGPCTAGGLLCIPGREECVGGRWECRGGAPREPEKCDCMDNDCDTMIDEDVTCAGGGTCINAGGTCQCARPCNPAVEFACPVGQSCQNDSRSGLYFCVSDPCSGMMCPRTESGPRRCVVEIRAGVQSAECKPLCETIACGTGTRCNPETGACLPDNCTNFPTKCNAATERCVLGTCEARGQCGSVVCGAGEFCRVKSAGMTECAKSCATVMCATNEACVDGSCVADRCVDRECDTGLFCERATGVCRADGCRARVCAVNSVCDPITGSCVRDPCLEVRCPGSTEVCVGGQCIANAPSTGTPDAGVDAGTPRRADLDGIRVLATGGTCSVQSAVGSRTQTGVAFGVVFIAALMLFAKRRRSRSVVRSA